MHLLTTSTTLSTTFERITGNARKLGKDGFIAMYAAELALKRRGSMLCCHCLDGVLCSGRHQSEYLMARVSPLDSCESCGSASEDTLVLIDLLAAA